MSKWISVKEKKPQFNHTVRIYTEKGFNSVGFIGYSGWLILESQLILELPYNKVTHWAELDYLEPPKID